MLNGWSDFFTTTGAAGGVFVGLLFVVVTLGTGLSTARKLDIAHASLTPAMYSFGGVLLQSMVVLVPWQANWPSGLIFVGMGIGGLVYRIKIVRARNRLHLSAIRSKIDRMFHNLAPHRCERHPDLWRRRSDRRSGLRPFRRSGRDHATPRFGNLPNLG